MPELVYQITRRVCVSRPPLAQNYLLCLLAVSVQLASGESTLRTGRCQGRYIAVMVLYWALHELPKAPKTIPTHCRHAVTWECVVGEAGGRSSVSRAMADFAVATGKDFASFSVAFYLKYFEQKIERRKLLYGWSVP